MGRFPIEGLAEFTEDDLETAINTIRETLEMKPGVKMKEAFDTEYFKTGTMVVSRLHDLDNPEREPLVRTAMIMKYENNDSVMWLNEPRYPANGHGYAVEISEYLSGRVTLTRLVEEETE